MFSPRAENLSMPGRLEAVSRSRWEKSPLAAMCLDQSAAMPARASSQFRAARPLALRSAFSRPNRSWVMRSAVVAARLVAAALEDGGAVALGGLVVAGAAVVDGALVVLDGATGALRLARVVVVGCRAPAPPWSPPPMIWPTRAASAWIEFLSDDVARSALGPSGRACAGSRNHASTSGSTITAVMRRLAIHEGDDRACRGTADDGRYPVKPVRPMSSGWRPRVGAAAFRSAGGAGAR